MRVGKYQRLGPDLTLQGIYKGTHTSPHIVGAPNQVQTPWLPPTIRGRHAQTVPRHLGPVHYPDPLDAEDPYGQKLRRRSSLVPGDPVWGHSLRGDDHQKESKLGLYIFLGILGGATILWLQYGAEPQGGRR